MSPTHVFLLALTAACGALAMVAAYWRHRDPFHPLLIACPVALFFYVYMPWNLASDADRFAFLVPVAAVEKAQVVFLCSLVAFCVGVLIASRRARWSGAARAIPLSAQAAARLYAAGVSVGVVGIAVWVALIASQGGLAEVYGQSYGGEVLHPWGWVRETRVLPMVGALLCLAAAQGSGRRVAVAALLMLPQYIHAVLGARRGPMFAAAMLLVPGFYVLKGRRPRLALALAGGGVLGLTLIFLLANRPRIYLGSEEPLTFNLLDVPILFEPNPGNEYIVGAALMATADLTGRFGWGLSYVEQLVVRPIPRAVMPDKYELLQQDTVGFEDVTAHFGWRVPPGSFPTLFAQLYIEFWWLCLLAAAAVGAVHGWCWRRSLEAPAVGWLALQVLMMLGLLELIAQDLNAMLVPFLLRFAPLWLALRWALDRPFRLPTVAIAVPPTLRPLRTG